MKNTVIAVWRIAYFAAILALAGCATKPAFESFSHKDIKHPAPLATSTAAKGQPVYLHYDYDSIIVYHLQEPLEMGFQIGKGIVVSNQEPLYRGTLEQKEVLCSRYYECASMQRYPDTNRKTLGKELICSSSMAYDFNESFKHPITCFFDAGRAGKVDTVTATDSVAPWRKKSIGHSISYESGELVRDQAQPVKRELIFTGYAEGQLTFLYREYKNDLKNAAVNQPLFVPVESFPAKKEVKGLSIEFLSATDAQLSYKILAGFQP